MKQCNSHTVDDDDDDSEEKEIWKRKRLGFYEKLSGSRIRD